MKQLTVRGVDPQLEFRLKQEAHRRGLSMNRTVLAMLRQAAGISNAETKPREYHDLDHLMGKWTEQEAREFDKALKEMRRIEPEIWQ